MPLAEPRASWSTSRAATSRNARLRPAPTATEPTNQAEPRTTACWLPAGEGALTKDGGWNSVVSNSRPWGERGWNAGGAGAGPAGTGGAGAHDTGAAGAAGGAGGGRYSGGPGACGPPA